jgi:hypothetical protein
MVLVGIKIGGIRMRENERKKKGVIQFAEYVGKVAFEKRVFIIPCKSEKDANSKRVSMYNVRKTLPEYLQGNVSVQKMQVEGEWRIRLSYEESQVLEEINGVTALVNLMENPPELQRIIKLMRVDGISEEGIAEFVEGWGKDEVDTAGKEWAGEARRRKHALPVVDVSGAEELTEFEEEERATEKMENARKAEKAEMRRLMMEGGE